MLNLTQIIILLGPCQ